MRRKEKMFVKEDEEEDLISRDSYGEDCPVIERQQIPHYEAMSILLQGGCRPVYRRGMDPKIQIARGSVLQDGQEARQDGEGEDYVLPLEAVVYTGALPAPVSVPMVVSAVGSRLVYRGLTVTKNGVEEARSQRAVIKEAVESWQAGRTICWRPAVQAVLHCMHQGFKQYSQLGRSMRDRSDAFVCRNSMDAQSPWNEPAQYEYCCRYSEGPHPAWWHLYSEVAKNTIPREVDDLVANVLNDAARYSDDLDRLHEEVSARVGNDAPGWRISSDEAEWSGPRRREEGDVGIDLLDQDPHTQWLSDAAAGFRALQLPHPAQGWFRVQQDSVCYSPEDQVIEGLLGPLPLGEGSYSYHVHPVSVELLLRDGDEIIVRRKGKKKILRGTKTTTYYVRLRDLLTRQERVKFDQSPRFLPCFFTLSSKKGVCVTTKVTYYIEDLFWSPRRLPLLGVPDELWRRRKKQFRALFTVNRFSYYYLLRAFGSGEDVVPNDGHPVQQAYMTAMSRPTSSMGALSFFLFPDIRAQIDVVSHAKIFCRHFRHFWSWYQ